MLVKYLAKGIDLDSSFVIGDRLTDLNWQKIWDVKLFLLTIIHHPDAELCTTDWNDIYSI